MHMNYFIADLHFGHKNRLKFDNLSFKTIEEHDQYIIDRWNETVGLNDDVYILGDISWHNSTKTIEIFKSLNGVKHLIKGNHDNKLLKNRQLQKLFIEIVDYKELCINSETSIVLCHYPIPCFRNHFYNWIHFYGHVHSSFEWKMIEEFKEKMINEHKTKCEMYNVGVMMKHINFKPRTMEEILRYNG